MILSAKAIYYRRSDHRTYKVVSTTVPYSITTQKSAMVYVNSKKGPCPLTQSLRQIFLIIYQSNALTIALITSQ